MTFSSALLVALCYTTSVLAAQKETTWGSVVFTYHGEKTPSLASGIHHFTPRGAIQAQNAGQIIRERYIEMRNTTNSPPHFYPINGISANDIVNSQLNIMTLDDEIMAGSALAFTQGLFPPRNNSNSTSEESVWTQGYNGIGSLDSYPLGGYQYPSIKTVNTASDFDSICTSSLIPSRMIHKDKELQLTCPSQGLLGTPAATSTVHLRSHTKIPLPIQVGFNPPTNSTKDFAKQYLKMCRPTQAKSIFVKLMSFTNMLCMNTCITSPCPNTRSLRRRNWVSFWRWLPSSSLH